MSMMNDPRSSLPLGAARARSEERTALDDLSEKPPDDGSWRYRTDGPPRWLAILGIVAGFVALVVPGLVALRSYRRWRDRITLQPAFAWVTGIIAIWTAVVAGILLATDFVGLAVLVAVIGPVASVVIALRS